MGRAARMFDIVKREHGRLEGFGKRPSATPAAARCACGLKPVVFGKRSLLGRDPEEDWSF
jgi:hypothetical protein